MLKKLSLILCGMILSGCVAIHSPSRSKFLQVQGSEFTQTFQDPERLGYFVALNVTNPAKKTLYLDAAFQNPCDKKHPIKTFLTVEPDQTKVLLESPPVDCLKWQRYYNVRIKVYTADNRKRPVDRLTQRVYCSMDSREFRKNLGK